MAKKRSNPLSGIFHDPPKEADAPAPGQTDMEEVPVGQAEEQTGPVAADVPIPEQAEQGDAPAEQTDAPAEPGAADAPAPEQAEQGDTPAEQTEALAEPGAADAPAPEQAEQGDAPAKQTDTPADPAADVPDHEQAEQGDAPAEQTEAPADPAADAPAPKQAEQGDVPAEQTEAPADPGAADAPDQEQAKQGDVPAEQTEAPADPGAADAPDPEQAEQGDTPAEPTDAPAEPTAADTPAQEQDGPTDVRFVKIADIKPLPGTYVKDTPREDYSELIASIKEHGLEKPIILREGANGEFQLVDGFQRCEALKRAGYLEVRAEVYDMTPQEASRYRREHRNNPDLPIPGKLIPAHSPKEEPAAKADAPTQDEEEFEIPKNFTLPITKPGQAEIITTLKVADIHPFEGHPFLVKDNKEMFDLVESVKLYGVLEPVMVINRPAGGYEMVSGHRRMRACQLAGIETIPTIVRNLDRDEAIIAMVDANLKREEISPMEKARAYKMKTEAMRRKVGRRSKTEAVAGEKPLSADEELAKQVGESVATVQRYKQLTKLEPELQEMVDKGKIPVNTGADIALLKKEEQKELAEAIQREDKVPTGAQVKEMKKQSAEGTLTTEAIKQSVAPTKREENPPLKVTLGEEDLRPYFPDARTTIPDVKKGIFEALTLRQKLQERQKAKAQQAGEPKNETKPPDKPAAGDDKAPSAPSADPKPKVPAPKTGGVKKSTPSKKPPKKSGPAR